MRLPFFRKRRGPMASPEATQAILSAEGDRVISTGYNRRARELRDQNDAQDFVTLVQNLLAGKER